MFRKNLVDINRFYSSVICIILCILQETFCYKQTCQITKEIDFPDTNSKPYPQTYISCVISDAELKLQLLHQEVTTRAISKNRSNDDVQMVHYDKSSFVEYIPTSIYMTFPNLERLVVISNDLHDLQPQYFRNGTNLNAIKMKDGTVSELVSDVFHGVPNLEYINFENNEIKSIHKHAFRGLIKVRKIFLNSNQIVIIYYRAFSSMKDLVYLDMINCGCINVDIIIKYSYLLDVESAILKTCRYETQTEIDLQSEQIMNNLVKLTTRFHIFVFAFLVFFVIILILSIAILIMEVKNKLWFRSQHNIHP